MQARRLALRSLVTAAATLALVGTAQAGVSCHKINAKGVGQDLGAGQTEAVIRGGGLLNGTTVGSFAIVGGAPPVFLVAGSVMFTTKHATLTVALDGSFDVSSGAFTTAGPVSGSTGKLAGATGMLMLDGVQDLVTGKFTETVQGVICVDLKP